MISITAIITDKMMGRNDYRHKKVITTFMALFIVLLTIFFFSLPAFIV